MSRQWTSLVLRLLLPPLLLGAAPRAVAETLTATVPTGSGADAFAVNAVTNKIYVANYNAGTLTIVDGAAHATTTLGVGTNPIAVAVNPVTNKVYVVNSGSNSVTVIDGATAIVATTVGVGTTPSAVAVNPVTNKIYVANDGSNNVTIIDGATNGVLATPGAGTIPRSIAVNSVTNKVYVATIGSSNVTVISGATNAVLGTIGTGLTPMSVVANVVTNMVYVGNSNGNSVTVIDGSTDTATATVGVGLTPHSLAVNPVTNRVYSADNDPFSPTLTVIDGATNAVLATTPLTGYPASVAVNPVTNRVYVTTPLGGSSLAVVDGATNAVVAGLNVGMAQFVGVNPVTNRVYVTTYTGVAVVDGATNATASVPSATSPIAVGVNPATDKIYVANSYFMSNSVTVMDGPTGTVAATVPVGSTPAAVAANPRTNRIYVANSNGHSVSVIDGATSTVAATVGLGAGAFPVALAVNTVTNRIYTANQNGNSVTAIDGATHLIANLPAGSAPRSIAVNPVTNRVYAANYGSHNVTVIDGATRKTLATVPAGMSPRAIAVNPVTNRIYVANSGGIGGVTVIDGATNTVAATVPSVGSPGSVGVNPLTNRVYVANWAADTVTVIDGATNGVLATLPAGDGPQAIAVNPTTNKIHVANQIGDSISVIDGATNGVTTVAGGDGPIAAAVNPLTNKAYVANFSANTVTVLTEQAITSIPLTTSITPLPGDETSDPTPTFALSASSGYSPITPPEQAVYFQVDTWQGPWQTATALGGGNFDATTSSLALGTHVLFAFASDGQDATACSSAHETLCSPRVGQIAAYVFTVVLPPTDLHITKNDGATQVAAGSSTTYTVVASNLGPNDAPTTVVIDPAPFACYSVAWTCSGAAGGSCGASSGAGTINEIVSLPVGGSVTYLATCTLPVSASGSLTNLALVSEPGSTDPDTSNNTASDTDSIVCPDITVLPPWLPAGFPLVPYGSVPFSASGGLGPYTFSLSGTLPSGMTFLAGTLSGTPGAAGNYPIDVQATASNGCTGLKSYALAIGTPVVAGDLVISEFRFRGLWGPEDEYVEVHNRLSTDVVVGASDGSAGFGVGLSDGTLLFTIPNGTLIPARGHYLGVNENGYSLDPPAWGDTTWDEVDIPDDSGIALFSTDNPSNFGLGTRLDAVGFQADVDSLYKEGGGLANVTDSGCEYAFVRKAPLGTSQDTGSNAADFHFVDGVADVHNGVQSVLGAPGPENLSSPVDRSSAFSAVLIEPNVGVNTAPNRARTGTGNSGTLQFRRRLTNNTGDYVTRLRLHVTDLTTLYSPGYTPTGPQADLRPMSHEDVTLTTPTSIGVDDLRGLTLEMPPFQPIDGGVNSTLDIDLSLFEGPMPPGGTIDINVVMNIWKTGSYRYFINIEAITGPPS